MRPSIFTAPLALALVLAASGARADEEPAAAEPTAPAPTAGTTVVAPAGSGVTVVAPVAGGGKLTAKGCSVVQVEGAPTVVQTGEGIADQACAPYQPYQPAPQIIYVHDRPQFAKDSSRSVLIVLGALTQGLGSLVLGAAYVSAREHDYYSCHGGYVYDSASGGYSSDNRGCSSTSWAALGLYTATMAFAPTVARFEVGATTSGWVYAGAITASIALGRIMDGNDRDARSSVGLGGGVFGFLVPAALGIVSLATTPHREDLAPRHEKAGFDAVGLAPVVDKQGSVNGASMSLAGKF